VVFRWFCFRRRCTINTNFTVRTRRHLEVL
jgi:hypothetical protein